MTANRIRADHDQLRAIARSFGLASEQAARSLAALRQAKQRLQDGDWIGAAAARFYAEMDAMVLPTLQRLVDALDTAARLTEQSSGVMLQAARDAAAILRADEGGSAVASTPAPGAGGTTSSGGGGGGFLRHVGGFFEGVWEGAKGTAEGLWHAVTHPIDTVKGLAYGITHPGELWDALKKPYVEDWSGGNYGRAIDRGAFEVAMLLIPGVGEGKAVAKGVEVAGVAGRVGRGAGLIDKAADVARVARAVSEADDLVRVTGTAERLAEAGRLPKTFDQVGLAAREAEILHKSQQLAVQGVNAAGSGQLVDDIARLSTHGTGDRLVLGQWVDLPNGGGYIAEARLRGGVWYETPDGFYPGLKATAGPAARDVAWATNERVLLQQLEAGISRIDFVGERISDVLVGPARNSARAREIQLLLNKAEEYGYVQVGNSWVRVSQGTPVPIVPPRVADAGDEEP